MDITTNIEVNLKNKVASPGKLNISKIVWEKLQLSANELNHKTICDVSCVCDIGKYKQPIHQRIFMLQGKKWT